VGESERALASLVCRTNRPARTGAGELAAPLIGRDGRNMGVVQIMRRRERDFVQEEEDILVQLAQMASIAVENTLFCEAREANRLKDEFLATVSHELRTPLNAMVSWAWMLRSGNLGADGTVRAAEAIERSVKAQARIVDDLLDVSRIVSGKLRLASRVIDVAAVVGAAIESVIPTAEAKEIALVRDVEPRGAVVFGDPGRLQQVVWNLLSNAIKFTPAGGRIEVALRRGAREAELRVTDNGQGIAPGFLPHVFERFRQADGSTTRRTGGLGLGLSIVQHLVELHGGRVEAQSPGEGLGATFVVTLPLAAALEETAPADGAAPQPDPAPAPRLDGVSVLLVEDDVDTREAVALVLVGAGASVTGVGSADEAIATLEAARPHVLLCDIGLPGEDGYTLVRRLHTMTGDGASAVPAVALTAYAHEQDRVRAQAAGFHTHVAKPVEPDELIRVLAGALASGLLLERPKLVAGGQEL
jgi:signal transduction histidine kinase/CheY-like chemotaxis protein